MFYSALMHFEHFNMVLCRHDEIEHCSISICIPRQCRTNPHHILYYVYSYDPLELQLIQKKCLVHKIVCFQIFRKILPVNALKAKTAKITKNEMNFIFFGNLMILVLFCEQKS